ncbi:HUNB-like protein [Mya arenaria]|uniref:HUNB-like protein n=2 Tax=Mya arenaria TaxID=6604 RepID=A0ABY7F7Z7_MYAAR|nr:HUNB-like protein [Mya arenaria]
MTVHFEHVCPNCDYKSRTEGRLKRHIKDFHTEDIDGGYGARTMPGRPKVFRCKQCEYSTTEKIDFWTHSRSHIKEDKLLQCPRCPFVTEYKHHLEYHLRNHFGSKPFKCPKCNYACVNKSMLNSHMKSHTNVYQYRCADCTYATKYCHSLKLHLRKYNHKPAAVLNSDGSLPQGMDATNSGLSLLAKRGPPRGPRGPRKDKHEMPESQGGYLSLPPSPLGPLPGMQGMQGMLAPFWPMMQMQGRIPHPLSFGQRFNSPMAGLSPLGIKSEDRGMKSPPTSGVGSANILKCNFCSFIATSREILTGHIMKLHASDQKDLFSMFGLSSEALLDESHKRHAPHPVYSSPAKMPRLDAKFNPDLHIKKEREEVVNKAPFEKDVMSRYPFMSGKYGNSGVVMKDDGIDILKEMTLKFGAGLLDQKRKHSLSSPLISSSKTMKNDDNNMSSDSPLDLTKPRSPPSVSSLQQNTSAAMKHKFADEVDEHSSGENSIYSVHSGNGVSSPYSRSELPSPPARKRSRKGQAFKLDALCMKLQSNQGAMYSEEDSDAEIAEMYSSDRLPMENNIHTDRKAYNPSVENEEKVTKVEETVEEKTTVEGDKQHGIERDSNEGRVDVDSIDDVDGEMKLGKDEDKNNSVKQDLKSLHYKLAMLNEQIDRNENQLASDDNIGDSHDNDSRSGESSGEEKPERKSVSPPVFPSQSRRKQIPAAIQRGADIAWKMLNDPHMGDPSLFLKSGNGKQKLEMTPLDKKLWFEAPECTNPQQNSERGVFECPYCKISFGDCIMYTMHMGYHGYKDPYKCNMCGDTCKDRVEFFLHISRAAHH